MRTIDLAAGDSSSSSDEDDGIIICRRRRQPSLACLSNPKQQKKREPWRCQTLKNRRTKSDNSSPLAQSSPDERKMPFSSDNINDNSNVDENDVQESSLRGSARQRYNNNNDESQSPIRKRSRGEDGRGGFDGISATDSDNDMDDSNSCNLLVARKPTPAEAKRLRSLNNNEVRSVTNDEEEEEEEEEEVKICEVIDLSSPIARRRSTAAIMNNGMMGPSSPINSWDQLHRSHAAMSSHAAASSQRYQYRNNMDMPMNVAAAASTTPVSNGRTKNESRQHRQDVATSRNATSTSSSRTQRQQQQQWACPRCTLLNNQDHSICGACQHENPTRRNNNVVGSGRSSRVAASVSDNDRVIAEAMAAAEGGSNFGTLGRGYRNNTGSLTSAFHPSLDGMMARMIAQQFGPTNPFSHLLQSMTSSTGFTGTGPSQQRGENVDNMSYEQLLQRFGDGSENRGATTETISSLPTSIVNDPGQLPEDKRQCCICLEDFSQGDGRTSLPCLHGFHTDCVNKWLQSNGSCPICKSSVKGD